MTQEMTPNQVVAWNLWQARKELGWSQETTSRALAEHGVDWEKATYYSAEAGRASEKQARRFSADEILAFALTFRKPFSTFLTPPANTTMVLEVQGEDGKSVSEPLQLRDLLELGLNRDLPDLSPLAERLREVATVIETFEEGRRPEPAAKAIVEHADRVSMESFPEMYGDTGRQRMAMSKARRAELAREHIGVILKAGGITRADDIPEDVREQLAKARDFYSDVVPLDEVPAYIESILSEQVRDVEEGSA